MYSLFGKSCDRARKHARLSEQDHPTVIERGRGVEFHLQDVEFDDDDIPGPIIEFSACKPSLFLSPDGKAVFTVPSCCYKAGCMEFTERYFIVRHSLIDGQGSYFHIAEFDNISSSNYMEFYALSNDRIGALIIDREQETVNQYVIRIGHRPRLAEVTARHSFPLGWHSVKFNISLQLDGRIMLSGESHSIAILAADIEAPESKKYCRCCRLDGYFLRLEIEARNRNVLPPPIETLTLGRNGVYACVWPRDGMKSFYVLGLEWQRNNELPADLCRRRVEDTVLVFYRFDQQFATIRGGHWFKKGTPCAGETPSVGLDAIDSSQLVCQTPKLLKFQKRLTLDVFVLDLTKLVLEHESFRVNRLNFVPGTSSVVAQFGHPSNLLRLRSAFDVPPLRQLAFETVYKHMKPEERSKPRWMRTLCGFECV